jgi:hypothetical protein
MDLRFAAAVEAFLAKRTDKGAAPPTRIIVAKTAIGGMA